MFVIIPAIIFLLIRRLRKRSADSARPALETWEEAKAFHDAGKRAR